MSLEPVSAGASAGGSAGDLFAEIHVVLPTSVDDSSAELLRQFDERNALTPRRDLKW